MTGKITRKFRQHNADQFAEAFSEAAPTNMYFFIARPNAWANDTTPPTPLDSTQSVDYDIWNSMIAVKRVSTASTKFGALRNNWANNSTFAEYTSSTELDENFFVCTDEYNVYKVISNHKGIPSTVKPTGKLTTTFETADGYIWKFMYSINVADALSFLTESYVPVPVVTSNDGSDQYLVQQAAVNGSINNISISNGGSGYVQVSNTFVSVANATSVTLAASSSGNNNFYVGSSLYVSSGSGIGSLSAVTAYDGTTKVATLSPALEITPSNTSTYVVSPKVTLTGTGTGFSAYSVVANNAIDKIEVIGVGNNYTSATAVISANAGTGALVSPVISPLGGHGLFAKKELFAHNVILGIETSSSDSNFMTSNDYRVIGLVSDPVETGGNTAVNTTYDMTTRITITSPTGNYFADEIVTGQTSGATGIFIENRSNTVIAVLKTSTANFVATEVLLGGSSGYTSTVSSIALPELTKYTGNILYYENRRPISRSSDQKENVKIVVKF